MYVPLEIHIEMENFVLIGQEHQGVITVPDWLSQALKLRELFHKICISTGSIL